MIRRLWAAGVSLRTLVPEDLREVAVSSTYRSINLEVCNMKFCAAVESRKSEGCYTTGGGGQTKLAGAWALA